MSQPPPYCDINNNDNGNYYSDLDDQESLIHNTKSFSHKPTRMSFIRKVYGILSIQLLFTFLICIPFMYVDSLKEYVQGPQGNILLLASFVGMFVTLILMMCTNIIRHYPLNIMALFIFTIFNSFMLGVTTSYYDTNSVLLACGATSTLTFGLTMYSILTKKDFTTMGGTLFSLLIILLFMGIASIFIKNDTYELVYTGLGALLFSFYIIYDTQLIIGGKNKKYQLEPDEYVYAALTLYLDIINLFLYILDLITKR